MQNLDFEDYSFKDFVNLVKNGVINDDDGVGGLYINTNQQDKNLVTFIRIRPSELSSLTVRWYSK